MESRKHGAPATAPQSFSPTPAPPLSLLPQRSNHYLMNHHHVDLKPTASELRQAVDLKPSEFELEQASEQGRKRPANWAFWETQDYTYEPKPERDPFEHSRSLRHQQPSNPRRRKKDDDDDEFEMHDEEEDSDLDEASAQDDKLVREQRAYKEMLPRVQKVIGELGFDEKWTLDREEKLCMVCPFPQRLKGWKALLQHAENFQKRRPIQHRAYYRALSEVIKGAQKGEEDGNSQEKAVLIESCAAAEELMVWPPVVIVDNMKEKEYLDRYVPKLKPSDVVKTFRFSNRGMPGRLLVLFPATEVGHLNSKMLVDSLARLSSTSTQAALSTPSRLPHCYAPGWNPAGNLHNTFTSTQAAVSTLPHPPPHYHIPGLSPGGNLRNSRDPPLYVNTPHWAREQQRQRQWIMAHQQLPRGFFARPADMQMMDPQKKLITWTVENKREILKSVLKKSKEEHELGKAKVQAKLDEVDHFAESHQEFKSRKAILSQQLRDAEMALQMQKQREEQIAKQHADQLQMMDEKFKEELRALELDRVKKEENIRMQLEANEKQLEIERTERRKEVDYLMKHFEHITQQLQKHMAQKALDKEQEIARKREAIVNEIKLREAKVDEEGRNVEHNLLVQQELEKMKFMEEYNKMRQEFLNEWVEKQVVLKEKAEKAKQEKENLLKEAEEKKAAKEAQQEIVLLECSVCFVDFDEDTKRALIQPCGHAKVCVQCAVNIFNQNKLCPICRVRMSVKPRAVPTKLYM